MIGTGPFMLDSFEPRVAVRLRRNPTWFARDDSPHGIGNGRPVPRRLRRVLLAAGGRVSARRVPAAHRRRDRVRRIRRRWTTNARRISPTSRWTRPAPAAFLASRFLLDRAPFNDDRVRRAIHLAIDRAALDRRCCTRRWTAARRRELTGPIAPVMRRAGPSRPTISRSAPGYRTDAAGRAEDIRDGEAALGSARSGGATDRAAHRLRRRAESASRNAPSRPSRAQLAGRAGRQRRRRRPTRAGQALIASALRAQHRRRDRGCRAVHVRARGRRRGPGRLAVPAVPQRPADEHVPPAGRAARRAARQVARRSSTRTRGARSGSTCRTTCWRR